MNRLYLALLLGTFSHYPIFGEDSLLPTSSVSALDDSDNQAIDIHDELKRLTNDLERLQHQVQQIVQVLRALPGVNLSALPNNSATPVPASTPALLDDPLQGAKTLEEAAATRNAHLNLNTFLPEGSLQADYDQLMVLINAKEYPKAEVAAKTYLQQYERDENAQRGGLINKVYYWLAEVQYQQAKYADALASIKGGYSYPYRTPMDDKKPEYICLLARSYYKMSLTASTPAEKDKYIANAKASLEEGLTKFPTMDSRTKEKFIELQSLLGIKASLPAEQAKAVPKSNT